MKPATISDSKITIDEAEHRITVRVHEDELSKAIGRRGQNARLTSRLLGWDVKVERDESAHEQFEERVLVAAKNLAQRLEIDEELALGLVRGGMTTVDMVASVDASDIQDVVGVDEAEAKVILQKSIDLMGGAASDAAAAGAASSAASEPVASATTAGS